MTECMHKCLPCDAIQPSKFSQLEANSYETVEMLSTCIPAAAHWRPMSVQSIHSRGGTMAPQVGNLAGSPSRMLTHLRSWLVCLMQCCLDREHLHHPMSTECGCYKLVFLYGSLTSIVN